ncbi:universal stress protein [Halopiger aswanensis]|uniref:Nucleotide-binding universal stress UspA family protein n=1 Tax=Halopiger aswanensis TaxID=148449 RepID=A0A419WJ02_9EURY|nr:universal stress protein [Halopiger aswanensis]RKD95322.1 nucleotide-binding universal stress UspA family protein [Halopiger aswanensis]
MVVVTAIDGEEGSSRVLSEAWTLANRFDEPLHAVLVYEGPSHRELITKSLNIEDSVTPERAQEIAESVLADVAEGVTDEYEAVGRTGEAPAEILEYAEKVDARYIVVGGRSRSPVGKALFGSVTQSVLLDASCPVLAVMDERERG